MTPDANVVNELCRHLAIPIRVMIRSTPTGFEVNEELLDEMIYSIERFKMLPIEGFVAGLLKNGLVDRDAMEVILRHVDPLPLTFHKAIDESETVMDDVAWMNGFPGIDNILTSGGAIHAIEGMDRILLMKSIFKGTIMAGGKIIPQQITSLHKKLGLEWYHGRGIVGDLGN